MTKIMFTDDVQDLFQTAIDLMEKVTATTDMDQLKQDFVKQALTIVKLYSASGNTIPGLGGLGLEQGLDLARAVIEAEGNVHFFRYDFRSIARVLAV